MPDVKRGFSPHQVSVQPLVDDGERGLRDPLHVTDNHLRGQVIKKIKTVFMPLLVCIITVLQYMIV